MEYKETRAVPKEQFTIDIQQRGYHMVRENETWCYDLPSVYYHEMSFILGCVVTPVDMMAMETEPPLVAMNPLMFDLF